jgi:DNA-binding NarL/FixJ family response regulator
VGKIVVSPFISIDNSEATICGELTMTTLSNLTSRELEILQLVLAGFTNKAIAAEISISEKTVEFHLDNIYTKIGVRTRLMAGIWALQQGIAAETRGIPS